MMDGEEVMVGMRDLGGGVSSSSCKIERQVSNFRESENLGIDLLEDLDSYWEDISDRLTISRMVSDSVMKGMVKAVEQLAAEKVVSKELEVARLKERFFHQLGADKSESSGSPVAYHESTLVEHDMMKKSLCNLRIVAKEQIKKLKKEIDSIRGCSSMRRISSGLELVGLGGILQEKASISLMGVDKTIDSLNTTLDTICTQVDDMVCLTKVSLCDWQQEQELQRELETLVMQSSFRSLQEEFEEKLWDQNACLCGSQSVNWLERIDKVSNLCKELDVLLKSLPNPETGHIISHGSQDMEHFQRKALSNHVSTSTSLWEGNCSLEEPKNGMPENWDAAQLKHMTKDELVTYFNTVITNMRRNHESKVQGMTEEFFSLKREYLKIKEKGSLPPRKDKNLDILRKKIPQFILKLDDILMENENFSTLSNNAEYFGSFKDRVNSLLLENRQLRDSLIEKRKEVKFLMSQISEHSDKTLQHSLREANLLKMIGDLKSAAKDAEMEASFREEVYKCVLRELTAKMNHDTEDFEMQSILMLEIYGNIFRGAAKDADPTSSCEIQDADIESLVMQGLSGVIFREAIMEAQSQANDMNAKYLHENEIRLSIELLALEKEQKSSLMIEENKRLKQEILLREASLKEKEKLALELSAALAKARDQFELASQKNNNLKNQANWLQTLFSERSKELESRKGELAEALEQIESDKLETFKLNQKVDLIMSELKKSDEDRNMLLAISQEKQNQILFLEAKENEQRKQMQTVIVLALGLSTALSDFERQVAEGIKKNNLRLEESGSQLGGLTQKINVLKRKELLYKQRLERRCVDLQMAEAEVDLLGDEVDTLLSLLKKMYLALDHYSPILQHYPGIIEILKLVRRELSGESAKPVKSSLEECFIPCDSPNCGLFHCVGLNNQPTAPK